MLHRISAGQKFFFTYGVVNTLARISKARLLKEME
jgi:hypothetical protein